MPRLSLKSLESDPRNSNVCSSEMLEKLRRNIERTGLYPPLIVRPHESDSERFILIDGHHRKQVLETLGHSEADCLVWQITDQEAQLALATLNTLRGTENLKKRAELLHSLTQVIPIEALSQLIPEASTEIQDMLALLNQDMEALDAAIQRQIQQEKETLPVPLGFLIAASALETVEKALLHFQNATYKPDRGVALVNLCVFALKQAELQHALQGKT